MKSKLSKLLAISATAFAGYKIAKDMGVGGKIVYKKEYEAAKKYIDAHYPHSKFTPLEKTDTGYVCIITTSDEKIILTLTKANEGIYIFSEQRI